MISMSSRSVWGNGTVRRGKSSTFRCSRCGACCTSGLVVKLLSPDIEQLLEIMPLDELVEKLDAGVSAGRFYFSLAVREDGSCVFYDPEKGCTIYEHRPLACRAYPSIEDTICPNRGMKPTREMLEARSVGERESVGLSTLGLYYYPPELILAWGFKHDKRAGVIQVDS